MATLVIGIGNGHRRDDGVGGVVASLLCDLDAPGFRVVATDGAGMELASAWSGEDSVIIVDAAAADQEPGTIHRFDAVASPLPVHLRHSPSTHAFGLGEAIELARALNHLPRQLIVYTIVGGDFDHGCSLTPRVRNAAVEVARRIRGEVAIPPGVGRGVPGDRPALH